MSIARRTVTTLHGRQDLPDLKHLYAGFPDMPLVSISNAQRAPMPDANFVGTVYHGLPRDLLTPTLQPRGGYLAFHRPHLAGEARRPRHRHRPGGRPAAARSPPRSIASTRPTFRSEIEPLLKQPGVEYIGEIDDRRKSQLPGRGSGAAVPDRLAGAVRPGHDRGDGLRHAGAGLQERLGAGGDRRGRDRLRGRHDERSHPRRSGACWRSTAAACAGGSRSGSPSAAWHAITSASMSS